MARLSSHFSQIHWRFGKSLTSSTAKIRYLYLLKLFEILELCLAMRSREVRAIGVKGSISGAKLRFPGTESNIRHFCGPNEITTFPKIFKVCIIYYAPITLYEFFLRLRNQHFYFY